MAPAKQKLPPIPLLDRAIAWFLTELTRDRDEPVIRKMQWGLLAFTILFVTLALSYPNLKQPKIDLRQGGPYEVGQSAPETLIAVTDVEFLREKSYEKAREDARRNAPLHVSKDFGLIRSDVQYPEKVTTFERMLEKDFSVLQKCRTKGSWKKIYACARARSRRFRRLNLDEFREMTYLPFSRQREFYKQAMNLVFGAWSVLKKRPTGEEKKVYDEFRGDVIYVHNLNHASSAKPEQIDRKLLIPSGYLYGPRIQKEIAKLISDHIRGTSKNQRKALQKLSTAWLYALDSVRIDLKATKEEQQKAVSAVKISDYTYKIKRGQVILKKGDSITEEMRQSLILHQKKRQLEVIKRILSIFIQLAALTFLMLHFVRKFSGFVIQDLSSNLIVFSTIWLFAMLLVLVEKAWAASAEEYELIHFFGAWVPIGIFVVLLSIIYGEKLAIPIAMYFSFLVFIASRYDGLSLIISVSVALSAAMAGAKVKRRFQFISASVFLSLVNLLLVLAGYFYTNRPILGMKLNEGLFANGFEDAALIALASGWSTIVVIGLLPVYEIIFNIPTRFRLQELADPSHPLLKQLFQRAPSTWTHTLMVAALSEKACERLGLNTMLTRTGVYFHDIGKMNNAGFFAENKHLIPRDENINKDEPDKAARVIIEHVTDGLKMAQNYRLPKEVIAFIPEHHGTSTMAFFYHQALAKLKKNVNRKDFRYPGPIPQSKETGIVMIADSVEAASRSLDEYSEESLDLLIQKIINIKLSENQLDESGLTIGDLAKIKEAFKDVLISSYHSRPKYPDQKSTEALENSRKSGKKKARKKKASKKITMKI